MFRSTYLMTCLSLCLALTGCQNGAGDKASEKGSAGSEAPTAATAKNKAPNATEKADPTAAKDPKAPPVAPKMKVPKLDPKKIGLAPASEPGTSGAPTQAEPTKAPEAQGGDKAVKGAVDSDAKPPVGSAGKTGGETAHSAKAPTAETKGLTMKAHKLDPRKIGLAAAGGVGTGGAGGKGLGGLGGGPAKKGDKAGGPIVLRDKEGKVIGEGWAGKGRIGRKGLGMGEKKARIIVLGACDKAKLTTELKAYDGAFRKCLPKAPTLASLKLTLGATGTTKAMVKTADSRVRACLERVLKTVKLKTRPTPTKSGPGICLINWAVK